MQSTGKRLLLFRKQLGLKQAEFASEIGVSQTAIGFIERDERKPSRSFLEGITKRYSISADWLLHGRGEMLIPPKGFKTGIPLKETAPISLSASNHGGFAVDGQDFVLIRSFDVDVSAGPGLVALSEDVTEHMAFSRDWIIRHYLTSDHAGLVRVKGVIMEPTVPDGALVLVDFAARGHYRAGIHIFRYRDDLFIKHLLPMDEDPTGRPKRIFVTSSNPATAPFVIEGSDLADFEIVGRVVTVIADV